MSTNWLHKFLVGTLMKVTEKKVYILIAKGQRNQRRTLKCHYCQLFHHTFSLFDLFVPSNTHFWNKAKILKTKKNRKRNHKIYENQTKKSQQNKSNNHLTCNSNCVLKKEKRSDLGPRRLTNPGNRAFQWDKWSSSRKPAKQHNEENSFPTIKL